MINEPDKLSMWIQEYYVPEANDVIKEAVQAAAQRGGFDVNLQFLPFDNSSFAKWTAAIQANQLPDIGMAPGYPAEYWALGKLTDVSDLVAEIGSGGGGWNEGALHDATLIGKQYWVPIFNEMAFTYWRTDLFQAAGYSPPITDLDTLLTAAQKMLVTPVAKGIAPIGMAESQGDWEHDLCGLLWAFGASFHDAQGNITSDKPEFLQAITWYTDLYTKYHVTAADAPSWDDGSNNAVYEAGKTAFISNPGSVLRALRKDYQSVLAKTTLGAYPGRGGNGVTASSNFPGLYITSTSKAPNRARSVIKTLMSEEFYSKFLIASQTNFLPTLKNYYDLPYFSSSADTKQVISVVPAARARAWPYIATPTYAEVNSQLLWGNMLQQVCVKHVSPQQAVGEFTTKAKAIDAENRKKFPELYT